mgnify:FL=1
MPYAPADAASARLAAAARLRDALAEALRDVHRCMLGPCGEASREAACGRLMPAVDLRNYLLELCEGDPDCPPEARALVDVADAVLREIVDACGALKLRARP